MTLAEKRTTDLNRILAKARARLIRLARLPSVQERNPSACNVDMAALPAIARYGASGAADLQGNVFCLGIPFTRRYADLGLDFDPRPDRRGEER